MSLSKPFPDVALVGAMKSATTTLASTLQQHPQLAVAEPKEPGFFSRDERYELGFDWYVRQFPDYHDSQLSCDASTCYSRSREYPLAAERLADANPQVKIIYLLRNPIERAYSHYCHEMAERFLRGESPVRLADYFHTDRTALYASEYSIELLHLREFFSPSQILCLRFERFLTDSVGVLAEISRFLETDDFTEVQEPPNSHENARGDSVKRTEVRRNVNRLRHSWVARSIRPVLSRRSRDALRSGLTVLLQKTKLGEKRSQRFRHSVDPLSLEVRNWLHERLDPHSTELESLLGWDLTDWKVGERIKVEEEVG